MKNDAFEIKTLKKLCEDNNRIFRKVGDMYETADRYDGSDAFRSDNIYEVIFWEMGYKK